MLNIPNRLAPNEKYIVYGLIDPNTKEIRYVGKTVSGIDRIREHGKPYSLKNDKTTRKATWIQSLLNKGQIYDYTVLFIVPINIPKIEANLIIYEKEQILIKFFRDIGLDLTNHTDGGPGAAGHKVSEETRKKMSIAGKKRGYPLWLKRSNEIRSLLPKKPGRPKTVAQGRLRRTIPGAKEKFDNSRKKLVEMINLHTNEKKQILGLRDAAKLIGGKCSKTGICIAIKFERPYYDHTWKLI